MTEPTHTTDSTKARPTLRGRDLAILALSVLLLMALLWLMNRWLFPDGTELDGAPGSGDGSRWDGRGAAREFSIHGAEEASGTVATLARIRRDVLLRPADELAWSGATAGAGLANRDAIQTLARSAAVIEFGSGSRIDLDERSLIVIQTAGRDAFVPRRRPTMNLHSGGLSGALGPAGLAAANQPVDDLEIELPHGRLRVFGADAARFRIGVNPDNTSTVSIFDGSAELHAAGRAVRIGANQGVTFGPDDAELVLRDLPATPRALEPASAARLRYGELPPALRFAWSGSAGVDDFRFVLARDPDFEDLIVDQRVRGREYRHANLQDGRYFWRVSSLRGWTESPPTSTRRLILERDTQPPALSIDFDAPAVADASVTLRGRTEPGAQVLVLGSAVARRSDGRFEHDVALQPGANLIVVEAIDSVGNLSVESLIVHHAPKTVSGETP